MQVPKLYDLCFGIKCFLVHYIYKVDPPEMYGGEDFGTRRLHTHKYSELLHQANHAWRASDCQASLVRHALSAFLPAN